MLEVTPCDDLAELLVSTECVFVGHATTLKTPSGSPRLPDLRMVIVMDSRQPGMLHVDDVMQAGESRHQKELSELQGKLSSDDPINIQFTSVTAGVPS